MLASSDVTTAVALLDDDVLGDTNLNRHILAGWADIGELKALLARDRLAGYQDGDLPSERPLGRLPVGSSRGTARQARQPRRR